MDCILNENKFSFWTRFGDVDTGTFGRSSAFGTFNSTPKALFISLSLSLSFICICFVCIFILWFLFFSVSLCKWFKATEIFSGRGRKKCCCFLLRWDAPKWLQNEMAHFFLPSNSGIAKVDKEIKTNNNNYNGKSTWKSELKVKSVDSHLDFTCFVFFFLVNSILCFVVTQF